MKDVFYPNSVAVVGVSSDPDNLGRNIMLNLIDFGFDGVVYPVGPRGGTIAARRIHTSVLDIPDEVDMAVILVPARFVPQVLRECGQKGVRRAVIETAGFREYSEQGRALEEEVLLVAEEYGIRFIGPNCIGVINMENGFSVPFPRLKPFMRKGDVSIITQSGGVGLSILNHMAAEGLDIVRRCLQRSRLDDRNDRAHPVDRVDGLDGDDLVHIGHRRAQGMTRDDGIVGVQRAHGIEVPPVARVLDDFLEGRQRVIPGLFDRTGVRATHVTIIEDSVVVAVHGED